jgi:trehalose synthase
MIQFVDVEHTWRLDDYAVIAHLAGPVRELRTEASLLVPQLKDRTVWMVNSTAQGGGVAEMLPRMVGILGELGVKTRWVVIGTERTEFFSLTKRLHNMIHGEGDSDLSDDDRELYRIVSEENAEELAPHIGPADILVVHDPQPMGMGAILKQKLGVRTIWRCHIGLDEHLPSTRAAWKFLRPFAQYYDLSVFSAPEYIPDYLAGRATIIHPALDPFSHKNRELSSHKLVGILCNAGFKMERHPVLTPPFSKQVVRLKPDGTFGPTIEKDEVGLLYRPIVTQISRWDRLKGFRPLLDGFVELKRRLDDPDSGWSARQKRRVSILRLVLAGPDPASVQDDPEGKGVLEDLCAAYRAVPPGIQQDIALFTLPMDSRKENALMVNALQRCSTVIAQNSVREGFGLTATEAMWKRVPIVGTRAFGLRLQIRSGIDGMLTQNAEDPAEIAKRLDDMLGGVMKRDVMSRNAQRRAHENFLIFTQLGHWLRCLSSCASASSQQSDPEDDD